MEPGGVGGAKKRWRFAFHNILPLKELRPFPPLLREAILGNPAGQGLVSPGDGETDTQEPTLGEEFFVGHLEDIPKGASTEVGAAADGTAGTVGADAVDEERTDARGRMMGTRRRSMFEEERGFEGPHAEDEPGGGEVATLTATGTGDVEQGKLTVERTIEFTKFVEGVGGKFTHGHREAP